MYSTYFTLALQLYAVLIHQNIYVSDTGMTAVMFACILDVALLSNLYICTCCRRHRPELCNNKLGTFVTFSVSL